MIGIDGKQIKLQIWDTVSYVAEVGKHVEYVPVMKNIEYFIVPLCVECVFSVFNKKSRLLRTFSRNCCNEF